ncbi:SpoIIE family protein phosphatase [Nocardioides sp. zg-536]|uniref:SpoIIE family protein phosphatase n=1 Tax=Nocardioides faecalis TaxID=2803858 RepID=A0A938Y2Z4_9ACTN|nr:SpoIIE family protein phosphatase [Nocardioides faecalis]MBM9458285.1 SpoIIE family protein phosphatase [Nocardioides faecalis]QVI58314.1 SpoIIE family protein phosphatase [Nocardioides faecalis]
MSQPESHGVPPSAHTPAYETADLTTCDTEPIHIPGAIQPHGCLLAVDRSSGVVVTASENLGAMLGVSAPDALGLDLPALLGADLATRAETHALADRHEPLTAVLPVSAADPDGVGGLRGREVDVAVHTSGDRIVVELEPLAEREGLTYSSARAAMARLVAAGTVAELADQLAQEVRLVSGFDRVMVYRFDADWNGEVIAEDRREDLNPFLGLHYPATDIPAQARRLYTTNWLRLIADIGYVPVPLHPVLDPTTGRPLDLSASTLRSVSPIHIEYLSHMGVSASMSVSLVVDGKLWGLIACHHYSGPHRPGHEARAAAEYLGQISSQMMAERERNDERERALAGQEVLAKVTAALLGAGDRLLDVLVEEPAVRELVGAHGIALCFNDRLTSGGRVPPEDVCRRVAKLLRRIDGEAASHDNLAGLDPDLAEHSHVAAGALVVGTAEDRWLAWFRPEQEQEVNWGGDPSNAKLYSTEGPEIRLSPRKSFDKWREVVRGHSLPWSNADLGLANSLRTQSSTLLLHRAREQIVVAESLQRSIVTDLVTDHRGLEVAATYLPASEYQLGGDWWDTLDLPDDRVAFVIGDVAGHGVAAVAAMTQVRTALRAHLFAGTPAAESLDLLDRMMARLMGDQVASAIVAVIDPVGGTLELVNAGHPPPVLYGDGPARVLRTAHRPLLGVGTGGAEASVSDLPVGATLLLFTDGLIERRGRDLAESIEELRLSGEPGPEPGQTEPWSTALVDAVPGDRDDDTTVLAIRRMPR